MSSTASDVAPATVAFLFTDIEGSTRMWEAHPDRMRAALARHDALLRERLDAGNGSVFKTVGDAFCAAFATAADAVAAALSAQAALDAEPWPAETPIRVRMAVHIGAAESRGGDYFGPPLNRVARLLSAAHGGQIVVSHAAYEQCAQRLPAHAVLRDLGEHRLKDLARPEKVYELRATGKTADFPPLRSLSTHPNNLPQQLTSFIGRDRELADVDALLARHRMVTLTGTGGSGKTRLALHAAAEVLSRFPDGAWFVDLAPIADAALVPQAVATALDVREATGVALATTLARALRQRQLLLVLDNCEHLVHACASLVDSLVRHCPRLRVLATSREVLGIAGEQQYRVPSLSVPDGAQPALAAQSEAVQLFVDRARLVRPGFRVDGHADALASICRTLDGIPLAIELAAARVRVLSVDEIGRRLAQRFQLLTGGARTALPRHQTLRALIDWSYELLTPAEQRLLGRLAVFAGGWTLDAAEHVCAGDGVAGGDVLDLMTSLVNKSLVIADDADAHARYRLLETVRAYARDQLGDGSGAAAVRARHRDHCVALAKSAQPRLTGAEQAQWLQRLEDEHDNLRAALDACLADGEAAAGLRLCAALERFWATRGHLAEGRAWCARMLAMPQALAHPRDRADALHCAGALAYYQGEFDAARTRFEQSLSIREAIGDDDGIAASLNNLGNVAIEQADYATARVRHEASLALARELGNAWAIGNSLLNLGIVADKLADHATARRLYDECLAIRRQAGDRRGIAVALNNLGNAAFAERDLGATRQLHAESLSIRRELGDRRGIALSLGNLADLALAEGDLAAARALALESLSIASEIGDERQRAHVLEVLASIAAAPGAFIDDASS